jgi:hypothetical protein
MIGGMVVPSSAIVCGHVAGVETRDQGSTGDQGDQLDDWFERRLESRGIPATGGRRYGIPRILTLIGLVIALLGMFWALSAVGNGTTTSGSPSASANTQNTSGNGSSTGSSSGTNTTTAKAPWQNVTVDVLNGYGGANAAGTAAATLTSKGFKVGVTGNGGTKIKSTLVVFAAGHRAQAKLIAKQLKLAGALPLALAVNHGVPPNAVKDGVAIVLGPNGLPSTL